MSAETLTDITTLTTPASSYVFRQANVKAYESEHAERMENFGVVDAALAGMSLTVSMVDVRYWVARATAWHAKHAFVDHYNGTYPNDPIRPRDVPEVARAVLELSDIHAELGLK